MVVGLRDTPETGGGASPRPARFPCIDGLRGLSAAAVVLHHCASASGAFRNPTLGPLYSQTSFAVPVFVLVSGFVVYRPFVGARLRGEPLPATGAFLRRRSIRVYPAYWVATLVTVYLLRNFTIRDLRGFAEYMSLTWIFDESHYAAPLQPAWTLGTLLCMYALVPVLARMLLRPRQPDTPPFRSNTAVWLSLVAITPLYVVLVYPRSDWFQWEMRQHWLPGYLDLYAVGMMLATVSAAAAERRLRLPAFLSSRHMPTAAWSVGGVLVLLLGFGLDLPGNSLEYSQGEFLVHHYLMVVIAVLLTLPALFGPQREGLARRFLASRPMATLGGLSLGVYLWHAVAIKEFYDVTELDPMTGYLAQMFVVVMVASLALAAFTHRYLEEPLNRLARSGSRRATTGEGQPATSRNRS